MRADAAQLGQERPQLVEELDDVAADQPVELLAEDGDPALDVIDHRRACGCGDQARRVFEAMMPMKIDIATIEAARRG